MRGLIDNASGNAHQIAMLWAAIEKLSSTKDDCVPNDAQKTETFDAASLSQLMK